MTAKKISKKIIGIDLGTTNSCVAIQEGTSTRTILVEQSLTTPSYVTYGDQDELIVGIEAKRLIGTRTVLYDTKRLIGKTFSALDPKYIKSLGYKVSQGQDDNIVIEFETIKGTKKKSSAVEVAAQILQKIKKSADDYLGDEEAKNCVITVPAYFNSTQREQTKQAAELAGLNVIRIINEPTAAALFYGIQKVFAGKEGKQTLLVYDLGGGTFDLSILEIEGGIFEVKSTKGDNWLGGNDIDTAIVQAIIEQTGMSCSVTQRAMLTLAAEGAKKTLSGNTNQALINIPYFEGVKTFSFTLTRAQFQSILKPFLQRTESLVKQILKDVSTDIDGYILVGGQTRTIEFRDSVAKIIGKSQIGGVDPDLSVAGGAAIQGANLSTDASDEDVKNAEIVLLDVNPISLGMKVQGGIMCHMIKANATIPTYFTQMFVPASHNQTEAHIEIFQGERGMADDNTPLGEIILPLANPGRRENRQISVTFEIDANGMLKVTSTDVQTNKTESIQIDALKSGKIPIEEIKRIREEGEKHAALDKKLVHIAELKNKAEATCFDLQEILDTHAQISKRTEIEDLIRRARSLCLQRLEDTNDIEQMLNSLHEALLEAQKEASNLKNTKEDPNNQPNKNSDDQS